ncbi:MAG: class I SAM-dependent methyltransferase [Eggerthellaceae bacterium]|nr:class I SAM-dependent methyltransferase [Eggerthellaceae bacterium]
MNIEVDVAAFFDERAENWDTMEHSTKSRVQGAVLALVGIGKGSRVLDVACGTGVMTPHYLQAGVASVLGVDLSEKMIAVARGKFANEPTTSFVAGDVNDLPESDPFDAVVIYNAYPHFMDKDALVEKTYKLLKPGGRFVVAHGSGKDVINAHHDAVAAGVSMGLRSAAEESALWAKRFTLESQVDTPGFYAFSGVKEA